MEAQTIYQQAQAVIKELSEKANLKKGAIVVVGCSTSEVLGDKIGPATIVAARTRPKFIGGIRAIYDEILN